MLLDFVIQVVGPFVELLFVIENAIDYYTFVHALWFNVISEISQAIFYPWYLALPSQIFSLLVILMLESFDWGLQLFVVVVQCFYLLDQCSEFSCKLLFVLGYLAQGSDIFFVLLVDADLVFANET